MDVIVIRHACLLLMISRQLSRRQRRLHTVSSHPPAADVYIANSAAHLGVCPCTCACTCTCALTHTTSLPPHYHLITTSLPPHTRAYHAHVHSRITRIRMRVRVRACVCVRACAYVHVRVCMCLCMCVRKEKSLPGAGLPCSGNTDISPEENLQTCGGEEAQHKFQKLL